MWTGLFLFDYTAMITGGVFIIIGLVILWFWNNSRENKIIRQKANEANEISRKNKESLDL